MNECVVVTAGLLCLVAVAGYGVALGTKYWVITSLEIFGSPVVSHNQGLFESGCANLDCSKFGKISCVDKPRFYPKRI